MNLARVLLAVCFCTAALARSSDGCSILAWMGLERVDEDIRTSLHQLDAHAKIIDAVAFESAGITADAHFRVDSNLTDVVPQLKRLRSAERYAMISTYHDTEPHRRASDRESILSLFQNPEPFIDGALRAAEQRGWTGFNFDIEPVWNSTEAEGVAYAVFLDRFASAAHERGLKVTVAVATYEPFWNLPLIGKTRVDQIITMSTYTYNDATFRRELAKIRSAAGKRAAAGLLTELDGKTLTRAQLHRRLQWIQDADVRAVGLWVLPLPEDWWPELEAFAACRS